jgi:hypothetical protein
MTHAIDKITGQRVVVLREANTQKNADGTDRCVVIRHSNGTEQIQFKRLLTPVK